MATVFTAADEEFATSTGPNTTLLNGQSVFDGTPLGTSDLTITTNDTGLDARRFDPGERYNVSFVRNGQDVVLNNAKVVRSDITEYPVVVFSGVDANTGDRVDVVWAPEGGLQTWYDQNLDGITTLAFHTIDQDQGVFKYVCFDADTPILTTDGDKPAGALLPGDLVITQDGGPTPLLWVGKRTVQFAGHNASQRPICISRGTLGAQEPRQTLRLSPQHRVLVDIKGTRAFVPAKAILSRSGIHIDTACSCVTYVSLLLPRHSVLCAAGLACESLYPGQQAMTLLSSKDREDLDRLFPGVIGDPSVYGALRYPAIGPTRFARISKTAHVSFPRFAPAIARASTAPVD